MSPHMSIHEGDVDGPPLLQRADLEPITAHLNLCPPTRKCYEDIRGSKTPLVRSRDQNWPVGASINVSTVSCIY